MHLHEMLQSFLWWAPSTQRPGEWTATTSGAIAGAQRYLSYLPSTCGGPLPEAAAAPGELSEAETLSEPTPVVAEALAPEEASPADEEASTEAIRAVDPEEKKAE